MKLLLLASTLILLASCNEEKTETMANIAEENDMCICTKDYRPVCGSNGVTYPNSCQAGCDKITEYTQGACK